MSKGLCGYGRYNDDPECVGCPRAKSDMTPCIARDGCSALADEHTCVGCSEKPTALLSELRAAGANIFPFKTNPYAAADKLRDVVRKETDQLVS